MNEIISVIVRQIQQAAQAMEDHKDRMELYRRLSGYCDTQMEHEIIGALAAKCREDSRKREEHLKQKATNEDDSMETKP